MDDDSLSCVTESSSGLSDCDVTILRDDDSSKLIQSIEKELKRKFTVADVVPAGRLRYDNTASLIKHSKVTVVIITKISAKKYQGSIAPFFRQPWSHHSSFSSALILYEEGVKKIWRCFQDYIQLLLNKDPVKVAELIGGFVVAVEELAAESGDDRERCEQRLKEYFGDMLIHSILNPLKSCITYSLQLNILQQQFKERYGLFEKLSGINLVQHLTESRSFTLDQITVKQTPDGAIQCHAWFCKYENHKAEYCKIVTVKDKISTRAEMAKVERSISKHNAGTWIVKNIDGEEEPKIQDWEWKAIEPLHKLLYEFDSRFSFFLVSGKSTPPDKFCGISNIPWLKVFDFETKSRTDGILSTAEKSFLKSRSFSISSTASEATKQHLSSTATDWFFPLGSSDVAGTEYKGSALNWFQDNKQLLEQQFSIIADFCSIRTVPVFLILWYDQDEKNLKFLSWILSLLTPAFKCDTLEKKIILCLDEKLFSFSSMQQLIDMYELSSSTVCIQPETLYKWLASQKVPKQVTANVIRLPKKTLDLTDNELDIVEISKEMLWIKENIEVLSLESQDQIDQRRTEDFGQDFLKGGIISWDELASKNLAIERKSKEEIWKCLEDDVLTKQKSVKFSILHSPGGGGTTFARQLLWDLHFKVPCGVVVSTPGLWVNQISERVRFLHDKTHLPIVLLIEGRSEHEINQLYESCTYAIVILHVQRCSDDISENGFIPLSRKCILPGKVTQHEANCLTSLFSSFSQKSSNALKRLTKEVKQGKEKFMFEYGLTAFNHEFKGVRTYVQGYLKLHEQKEGLENLHNWQKVVAYLSLALYYGQSGLDCGIFYHLLKNKKSKEKFVSLDDVEHPGRQFIIETHRKWKISYNMVAKEILEQVLSRSTNPHESSSTLSKDARGNLHELIKLFILMIKKVCNGGTPENVGPLLVNMIIRRNNSEVEISDNSQKKYSFSKLLEDIPNSENRIDILRLLTQAFPRNAEFHAHLGRLLNIYKKFDEAEECLKKAITIRNEELKSMGLYGNSPDNMLGRIHHIFGWGHFLRATQELEQAKKGYSKNKYQNLLYYVKKAVDHFSAVRQNSTHSFSYGFLGEVHARLLVAEYVHQKFPDGCVAAFDGSLEKNHLDLSQFVCESHSVCDQLLAECLHKISVQELRNIRDYSNCVKKFTYYYGQLRHDMRWWKFNNMNIHLQRSHIACLKMAYKTGKEQPCIESITKRVDIQTIIDLLEKMFRKVFSEDNRKITITVDSLEWLEAIRHHLVKDKYPLVNVLETVSKWEQRNESVYATFYSYAINFLLAVFITGQNLNKEYYTRAKTLKEIMQSQKYKYDSPFRRLEWVANHNKLTIKKLINPKHLGQWDKDLRFWKEEKEIEKLQVFTGTVVQSHHPLRGNILLDTVAQASNKCRIEIYFVPKLYELDKSMYAEQKLRVEFCIGISPKHGAEAFFIRPLNTKYCSRCGRETEHITINAKSEKCNKCFPSF